MKLLTAISANQLASMLSFSLLFSFASLSKDGNKSTLEKTLISSNKNQINKCTKIIDTFLINVSSKDTLRFIANGMVHYSDFGAKGDGKTDDIDAIAATHAFANKHGLMVKADDGATYYISGKQHTAIIQTSTDFGTATFIIDDTKVDNRQSIIFEVSSKRNSFKLTGIHSLKKYQKKIKASLSENCIITVTNSKIRQYIRFGLNQNEGRSQTDIFVVDKKGNVDMDAPIIWDFDEITAIEAFPIDDEMLKITGGRFTTIANRDESKYNYYRRNIAIRRSNVIVDGLEHRVVGEEDHGAPYDGFINIQDCAYVTVINTILTGHKTYMTIGNAGKPVSMGSYDIRVNRALNVLFVNCSQTNDINNKTYWGIMASNYGKNLTYENCILSRFDAHMGVANATIRNSTLGHAGINIIGFGTFTLENSKVYSSRFINLRRDYGSTWQGNFIISNCIFVPTFAEDKSISASLFIGFNNGQHDFGYTCYMPNRITVKNLYIDDTNHPKDFKGPTVFDDFNPEMINDSYIEKFPYVKTSKVILKNVTIASGKTLRISENPYMFRNLKVKTP